MYNFYVKSLSKKDHTEHLLFQNVCHYSLYQGVNHFLKSNIPCLEMMKSFCLQLSNFSQFPRTDVFQVQNLDYSINYMLIDLSDLKSRNQYNKS